MPFIIGVLVPTSMMFPGVDQAFLAGLEGAVADLDPLPRLIIEPIGAGAQLDVVTDKIQRLLLIERPHAIAGVLGAALVPHVRKLVDQHHMPFIACNLGGDLLHNGGTAQECVFWNSLNLWQSTFALGAWAASNLGRNAAVAAAFHESGFGLVDAFHRGFVEAGGGRIAAIEVTHRESALEDPSGALARLASANPDFLFGLYSGREGVSFMNALAAAGLAGRLPLLSTAMMTHGHWLPQMASHAIGVGTACSWLPGAYPAAEAEFARATAGRGPRPSPDVWGLLGYEAGLILRAAVSRLGHQPVTAADLVDAIPGVEFSSPRGQMRMDAELREVVTVDHRIEIAADGGAAVWRSAGVLDLPEGYQAHAASVRAMESKSGWVNPYLVN
jgi:branched-chain amino acid transport system substrate-binding protein